ncbi:hypothetical protein DFJ63DRAFT_291423 [Scheffersomyces coipomensis]|uniref:uncharacterized protein n=1 Tax=Scheffersomyces coipomensis TaxID=1788519 RepID=UPI00315C8E91
MSVNNKQLPKLPVIIDNSSNLQEVDLGSNQLLVHPAPPPPQTNQKPSPLKQQITRSASLSSNESKKSSGASTISTSSITNNGNNPSSYMIQVNKTPMNLTPSQRLKLRKSQLNDSINKFKSNETHIDELIDENIYLGDYMYNNNLPFGQPVLSGNYHDLFLQEPFQQQSNNNNNTRKFSLTNTDTSTRASSILSISEEVEVGNETSNSSVISMNDDSFERPKFYKTASISSVNQLDFNRISKDAQELTLLFNQNEYIQMFEKSNQMKHMLTSFKKLNTSLPSLHSSSSLSLHSTTSTSSDIKHISLPSQSSPSTSTTPSTSNHNSLIITNNYQSFTRPTFLPPKDNNDRIKHQKQSNELLNSAVMKESNLQLKNLQTLEKIKYQRNKDLKIWHKLLLESNLIGFNGRIKSTKNFKDLYWRGIIDQVEEINDNIRGQIWWKSLNLNYNLNTNDNEKFCDGYFTKFDSLNQNHPIFKLINQDLDMVFPDILYFQNTEIKLKLTRVMISFTLFLQSKSKSSDTPLLQCYNPRYLNLIAILYYNYKNSYKTLMTLHQIYNINQSILSNPSFITKFEDNFNHHLHRLKTHFKIINLSPMEYLPILIDNLLTGILNFEISQHIIDIVIFEHYENYESLMIKFIMGLFNHINYKLFGSKSEIINLLNSKRNNNKVDPKYLNVGYEFDFIETVRNVKV